MYKNVTALFPLINVYKTIYIVTLAVVVLMSPNYVASEEAMSLDELASHIDHHLAKIPGGTVVADVASETKSPDRMPMLDLVKDAEARKSLESTWKGGTKRTNYRITVSWMPGQIKIKHDTPDHSRDRRIVISNHQTIDLYCPHLGTTQQREPDFYTAVILPAQPIANQLVHPHMTGVPITTMDETVTLVNRIRYWQSSKLPVKIQEKSDGNVYIEVLDEHEREVYIADPSLGFLVTSFNQFSQDKAGKEYHVQAIETEYGQSDGVTFPKRITAKTNAVFPDGSIRQTTKEVKIVSFNAGPIPETEFTVDALGLPVGSRIKDDLNGGEITYFGVEAPSAAALDQLEWKASGPRPGIDWWFWGGVGLGVVGLGVGAWSWRKTRAA